MGTPAKVELRTSAKLKPPVYLNAHTTGASVRARLRLVARGRWRATVTFTRPGSWTLHAAGFTATTIAQPPLASTFTPPGVPGCAPPSPSNASTDEALGSSGLWALFFIDVRSNQTVLDGVVGKHTKIVWRLQGSGDATFTATAPDGTIVAPQDLKAHGSSTWLRPGDEWGSIFVFTQPGCWQIHAARADTSGDLWLVVRS
jgi:hypothetical protein